MSRERISNYKVTVAGGTVTVHVKKPNGITLTTEQGRPQSMTVYNEDMDATLTFMWNHQDEWWENEDTTDTNHYYATTLAVGSTVIYYVGNVQEDENVRTIGSVTAITYEDGGYDAASQRIVAEAVRLIIDETALEVFCSSMQKARISSIAPSSETNYDIAITFAIPTGKTVTATDAFTVEFDWALPMDFSALAKQGTNPNATLSAVLEALQGSDTPSPDIPEGVAERLALILEYFGIKPISDYEFMQDTEVCDELEDIMRIIDPNLTAAQAAAITAQTLNPSES